MCDLGDLEMTEKFQRRKNPFEWKQSLGVSREDLRLGVTLAYHK